MPVTPDEFVHANPFDAHANAAQEGDLSLPTYTAEPCDDTTFEQLGTRTDLRLPLTSFPRYTAPVDDAQRRVVADETSILKQFFAATEREDIAVLQDMVSHGLVSPDVRSEAGMTPLAYAARTGKLLSAKCLVQLGADVNAMCDVDLSPNVVPVRRRGARTLRTPLMAAAEEGMLSMVKLLLANDADDAVVAPDGQIALRLAADNGHREIVSLLPARRAGAVLRLINKARPILRPLRKVARFMWFFVWDVPRFFLWTVPKHCLVLPLWTLVKNMPTLVKQLPGAVGRAGKWMWKAVKKIPGGIVNFVKGIPRFGRQAAKAVAETAKALWGAIKAVPGALSLVGRWIWTSVQRVASTLGAAAVHVVSFVHSLAMAIITRLRAVTLADLGRAMAAIPRAFISIIAAVWEGLAKLWGLSYDVLNTLFGWLGHAVWCVGAGVWWLVTYVPRNLGRATKRLGEWAMQAAREVRVWIDPKAV